MPLRVLTTEVGKQRISHEKEELQQSTGSILGVPSPFAHNTKVKCRLVLLPFDLLVTGRWLAGVQECSPNFLPAPYPQLLMLLGQSDAASSQEVKLTW